MSPVSTTYNALFPSWDPIHKTASFQFPLWQAEEEDILYDLIISFIHHFANFEISLASDLQCFFLPSGLEALVSGHTFTPGGLTTALQWRLPGLLLLFPTVSPPRDFTNLPVAWFPLPLRLWLLSDASC